MWRLFNNSNSNSCNNCKLQYHHNKPHHPKHRWNYKSKWVQRNTLIFAKEWARFSLISKITVKMITMKAAGDRKIKRMDIKIILISVKLAVSFLVWAPHLSMEQGLTELKGYQVHLLLFLDRYRFLADKLLLKHLEIAEALLRKMQMMQRTKQRVSGVAKQIVKGI